MEPPKFFADALIQVMFLKVASEYSKYIAPPSIPAVVLIILTLVIGAKNEYE